ncbi:unnamed protein product [Alopecurus aequalis]
MSIPANYPSALYSPELHPEEHVFLLYPFQVTQGFPQENQKPIGGSNYAFNWAVYDGPTIQNAKLVARLQGIYYKDANSSVDLLFVDERFPLSLKIAGFLDNSSELAIVGGTGEYAFAQGIVKARYFNNDTPTSRVWEFQIHAMVPTSRNLVQTPTPVTKDGPWGGNGGQALDITELPTHLESVTIGSGDVVDSLAFSYIDQAGNRHTAGPWGGDGGLKKTIQLAPTETVKLIVGTTSDFEGQTVVTSISIASNLRTYGPFGMERGNHFNTTAGNNIIVGFYVRAGLYVNNLGVYVRNN